MLQLSSSSSIALVPSVSPIRPSLLLSACASSSQINVLGVGRTNGQPACLPGGSSGERGTSMIDLHSEEHSIPPLLSISSLAISVRGQASIPNICFGLAPLLSTNFALPASPAWDALPYCSDIYALLPCHPTRITSQSTASLLPSLSVRRRRIRPARKSLFRKE